MFYSQFGEDRILAEIFRGRPHGRCVEVGANDGYHGSTTLHFEKLGWDCILVEPHPLLCEGLRANRSAKVFECAASDANGTAVLQMAEGEGLAHAVSTISTSDDARRTLRRHRVTTRPLEVPTRRLDDILGEAGWDQLDFISIDVEGHELAVLQGFSTDRWRPDILIVEDNSLFGDDRARRHLEQQGYLRFLRTGVNDWYAHESDSRFVGGARRGRYFRSMVKARLFMLYLRARALLKRVPGAASLYYRLKGKR